MGKSNNHIKEVFKQFFRIQTLFIIKSSIGILYFRIFIIITLFTSFFSFVRTIFKLKSKYVTTTLTGKKSGTLKKFIYI
jgi:hypothetical protein